MPDIRVTPACDVHCKTENWEKGVCNEGKHSSFIPEKILIEVIPCRETGEYFVSLFTRTLKLSQDPLCSSEWNS